MSGLEREEDETGGEARLEPAKGGANRTRRRLAAGGLAGAGVLMTMTTRSALGQTVGACGSESASAALSRGVELSECGCSPGFWWNSNGQQVWTEYLELTYPKTQSFNELFCSSLPPGVKPFYKDNSVTLLAVKGDDGKLASHYKCGNPDTIGMHAVAALLNAEFYGDRYPAGYSSGAAVIDAFRTALQGGCTALNAFKDSVDIYDDGDGLWCFNGKGWG